MTSYGPILVPIIKNTNTLPPENAYDFVYTFIDEILDRHRAAEYYARLAPVKPIKIHIEETVILIPKIFFTENVENEDRELAKLYLALTKEMVKNNVHFQTGESSHFEPGNPPHPFFSAFFTTSFVYVSRGAAAALPYASNVALPVRFNYSNTRPAPEKPRKNTIYTDPLENVVPQGGKIKGNRLNTIVVHDADVTGDGKHTAVYNIIFTHADAFDRALNLLFDDNHPIVTTLIDGKNTTADAINAVTAYYGIYDGSMVPVLFINNYTGKTIDPGELKRRYPNVIVRINGETRKIDVTHSGRGLIT